MRKLIAGPVSAFAFIAAVAACSTATTVVRTPAPKPAVAKTVTARPAPSVIKTLKPKPADTTSAPAPASLQRQPRLRATLATSSAAGRATRAISLAGTSTATAIRRARQSSSTSPIRADPHRAPPRTRRAATTSRWVRVTALPPGSTCPCRTPMSRQPVQPPVKLPAGRLTALMRLMTAADPSCPAYSQPGGAGYSG